MALNFKTGFFKSTFAPTSYAFATVLQPVHCWTHMLCLFE